MKTYPGGACAALLDLWKEDASSTGRAYAMRGLWVSETELDDAASSPMSSPGSVGELAAHEALLLVVAGFADLRHAELRLAPVAAGTGAYARPLLKLLGFLAAPTAVSGATAARVRPPLASMTASHELLGAVVSQAERTVLQRAGQAP